MLFPRLFDMLICPHCKGYQLKLKQAKFQDDEIWTGLIVCESCSQIYPVVEGIPCLLNKEQLEAQEGSILQQWLGMIKEIEKGVLDGDQRTYKKVCKAKTDNEKTSEDAERLLWEKKLYLDNKVLREELGDKQSKWAIARGNIKVRNDHVFRFIEESKKNFTWNQVLNVGPGIDDDLIKRLESRGIDIINCDIILDPLMQLRSNDKRECVCADLKFLPFDEGTFDALFCFHVIHHIVPYELALSEAIRVLRPDGTVLIIEVNPNHLLALQGKILPLRVKRLFRKCMRKYTKTSVRIYKPSPYEQVIPSRALMHTMSKVGFNNIIRKTAVHSPIFFPDYIISFWTRIGFRFPVIFDPIAFEHFFYATKSQLEYNQYRVWEKNFDSEDMLS